MSYTYGHDARPKCNPLEEVIRFVRLALTDRFTVTDLCEQFGISRKTVYKHLECYAPHPFSQRTDAASKRLIPAERRLHQFKPARFETSRYTSPSIP